MFELKISIISLYPDGLSQRTAGCSFLWAHQLHVIIWKNNYVRRICRHYTATILEIMLMVFLLYGIQEETVVREPLVRRKDTVYGPIRPRAYWNTQPDMAAIRTVSASWTPGTRTWKPHYA
ncbi:hypothetical protein HPB48_018281 [Haemaphysalis longicornis]|uniref:Uncharacterized protein n=1 Tax=Haemaphysalis longicornis TaxID=44386 RepID=A0A9J6G7Q9_HAELO|nr:hypothetical protein HPB48_018281 [Haemaphysalis longicornis]